MTFQFRKPARPVNTVFLHCSASDDPAHDSAAVIDAWHRQNGWSGIGYHFFIRKDGTIETGRDLERTPAAQEGHNTASIAICLHGLAPARFTTAQFDALRGLCAQINAAYNGALRFRGHCEVAAKACPVFAYKDILKIDAQGHIALDQGDQPVLKTPVLPDPGKIEVLDLGPDVLRPGSKGPRVLSLQAALRDLGYHVGALDGDFGGRTKAAVLAFQADNHLVADGIVGALTREALEQAAPRAIAPARQAATLLDLAGQGSRIASASIGNGLAGLLLGGGGAVAVVDQLTGAVSAVTGQADAIEALFAQHGLLAGSVILAAGLFVAWQSWRAAQARVEDHRTGKTA